MGRSCPQRERWDTRPRRRAKPEISSRTLYGWRAGRERRARAAFIELGDARTMIGVVCSFNRKGAIDHGSSSSSG